MNDESTKMKRCAGPCKSRKPITSFGKNSTSADGRKSYCNECTNVLGKRRRRLNISARIKHHIATRVAKQIGESCPSNMTKDLEKYLGYKIWQLRKYLDNEIRSREGISLKEALIERNYHIDHIIPLSSFEVNEIGDKTFRECWRPKNLRAISSEENLAKGAKMLEDSNND